MNNDLSLNKFNTRVLKKKKERDVDILNYCSDETSSLEVWNLSTTFLESNSEFTWEMTIMFARGRNISNIHPQSTTIILASERNVNIALLTIGCWRFICGAVRLIFTHSLSLTPIVEIHKEGWFTSCTKYGGAIHDWKLV